MPVVRTLLLQQTQAEWTVGEDPTTPVPAEIAFGTGGLDGNGSPILPDGTEATLANETHRNGDLTNGMDGIAGTVDGSIDGDVVGSMAVNEAGVFDAAGTMLLYATFTPRSVSPGVRLDFRFRL